LQVIQQNREKAAAADAMIRVEQRHNLLVRWTHWLNVPILLGLVLSGISIYWASPIYQHKPDLQTGIYDYFADAWNCCPSDQAVSAIAVLTASRFALRSTRYVP
jgi:hypothetical protein